MHSLSYMILEVFKEILMKILRTSAKQEILNYVVQIRELCHSVVRARGHGTDSCQKLGLSYRTCSQYCMLNPKSVISCLNSRQIAYCLENLLS